MPKLKRYCIVQHCENFIGTTSDEIHMFRFPTINELRELWINAINQINDENHKCNGLGSVCNLHFSSNDLCKFKSGFKLKEGSIPVIFKSGVEHFSDVSNMQSNNSQQLAENNNSQQQDTDLQNKNHCNNCNVLVYERDELKQMVTKLEINLHLEKQAHHEKTKDLGLQKVELKEKIRLLEKNLYKSESQIKNMEDEMRRMNAIENAAQKDVIDCLSHGVRHMQKYPESVRRFSLNMNFQSPRAYSFMRQFFNNHLPHESTITKWYANSDLHSEPGISLGSLKFLKEMIAKGSEVVVALCLDEMSIRKQLIWSPEKKQMLGYATYGCEVESPQIAKEAIVFVASGLKHKFRLPVAYHFVNSLDGNQKAKLLKLVLDALFEIGVKVSSITFDGHTTNKKMCEILGANLDIFSESFQPFIKVDGQHRVFIFYDICHMEKLIRGQFDKCGIIFDQNGDAIKWRFIQQLVKYSQEKGFSMYHRLGRAHLEWRRRPMYVRTAVETLSASTANAIEYLKSNGYEDFMNSDATSRFIRLFNDIFDIFNTKSMDNNQNQLKVAINESNEAAIFTLFDEAIAYIKALLFKEETGAVKKICLSNKKTGFVGIIINMHSLQMLYNYNVKEKNIQKFIPTFYLNQDAVEMFFGKIRSMGGFNDNPNVIHFLGAYRKLLANDSILTSRKTNCEWHNTNNDPFSDILFVTSRRAKHTDESEDEIIALEEIERLYEKIYCNESGISDGLQNDNIAYIASVIEAKIKQTDSCAECVNVFQKCKKIENLYLGAKFTQPPCQSTYLICKEANQFLKLQLLTGNIHFQTIYYAILNNLDTEQMFTECEFDRHPTHKLYLLRTIVDGYIQIKGTCLAKTETENLHTKKFRYKFKKLVHFYGQ